jgi:hypothetical protein
MNPALSVGAVIENIIVDKKAPNKNILLLRFF